MSDLSINPLFQPDSLAPVQFADTMQRSVPLEPEKRLMLAVLEDAVMCFQDNLFTRDKKKRQLFMEVEQWLFEEQSDRLFAFETLCQTLNLNPHYFRRGLRLWQESRAKNELNLKSHAQRAGKQVGKSATISHKNEKRKSSPPKGYHGHISQRRRITHTPHPLSRL
jgi:hypothetical protein